MSTCSCAICNGLLPQGPRMDETHVAVRLGDMHRIRVVLNGTDVTYDGFEACASQGWAALWHRVEGKSLHFCVSGDHACAEVRYGVVQLVGRTRRVHVG